MTDRDLAAFAAAWDRFRGWLSVRSPIDHAALLSPATAEEITTLETHLGFPLHPQLRALLERHNGVMRYPERDNHLAGAFLPLGHRLNGTDRIAREHEWLVDKGADLIAAGRAEDDLEGHPHQWVPFAHPNDGGIAFIDHRPGPTYGHVYEMGIGSGTIDATKWASNLTELFDDLATSLDTGEPFRRSWPNPYQLPSGHFCLVWRGSQTEIASMQAWPPPRRLDSPLRPAATNERGLGRSLGTLSGEEGGGAIPSVVQPDDAEAGGLGDAGEGAIHIGCTRTWRRTRSVRP